VAEIRTLLHGFRPETRPAECWATLGGKKLTELDEVIARAEKFEGLLEVGLRCGCLRLEDCELVTGRGCQMELPTSGLHHRAPLPLWGRPGGFGPVNTSRFLAV
jgi:hypothetical protein